MKTLTTFSVLTAALLMNAVVAFSGVSGPYGSLGSDPVSDMTAVTGTEHGVVSRGTGPYGSVGTMIVYDGGAESGHVARMSGSGPYGAFGPIAASSAAGNKDECMRVASNCVTVK